MKNDITNIINLENITRVRSSMSVNTNLPSKNSLVKLIPLEYLEQGVKVLIDGKLFIAFIDGKIPIKEEIIALVTNSNPVSLSLNISSPLKNEENILVDQILEKFGLKNTTQFRSIILRVIEEGNILIKSKIILLEELIRSIKVDGLEFSLLLNLVWSNQDKSRHYIEDLYDKLFDESFEEVCDGLFNAVNELLFSNIPQYLSQQIRNTLIYNEEEINTTSLINKTDPVFNLIKQLNNHKNDVANNKSNEIATFINYGTKYILQKSVFKEYDYYPDFVIVNREAELTIIHYSIKKMYESNNLNSYKIHFKHEALPFQLTGFLRDKFLVGDMSIAEVQVDNEEINSLEESLFNRWGFRSDIRKNVDRENEFYTSKINVKVNKLVS
jgi:hypothetical protein